MARRATLVASAVASALLLVQACADDSFDEDKTPELVSSAITEDGWTLLNLEEPIESGYYANNARRTFNVSAPEGADGFRLHFAWVDVERDYDFVRVYTDGGTLVDTITGEHGEVWTDTITGRHARVVLESDYSIRGWGFRLDALTYRQPVEDDGEWITQHLNRDTQIHTATPYENNFRDKWTLTAIPEATRVRVHFTGFNTEAHYDFVYLYDGDGQRVAAYDGTLGNFTSAEVEGNTVTVELVTDYSVTRTGFEVVSFEYFLPSLGCGTNADCPADHVCEPVICVRAPCPAMCVPGEAGADVMAACDGETNCRAGLECADVLPTSDGFCAEPAWSSHMLPYPIATEHPYPDNYEADFTVAGPRWAHELIVNFSAFNTERNYDFAYLHDSNGEELARYHGRLGDFESEVLTGNQATIRMESDYSVTRYGFDITSYQVNGVPSTLVAMAYEPAQCGLGIEPTAENLAARLGEQDVTIYGYQYRDDMRDVVCRACTCARGDAGIVLIEPTHIPAALELEFQLYDPSAEALLPVLEPTVLTLPARQCLSNPWDAYRTGESSQTEMDRLVAWADDEFGVTIFASWSEPTNMAVCLACNCPRGDRLQILVNAEDAHVFEGL